MMLEPCDLEAFDKIGKKHDIPIIYDSAQAMLSKYKGKSIKINLVKCKILNLYYQ